MNKFDLLYPILLECCQYISDNFWKNVFEDLAYGKCPYGIFISNSFLYCNYKDKRFSYKIDINQSSKQLYNDIYNLLYNKFQLRSNLDKFKNKKTVER